MQVEGSITELVLMDGQSSVRLSCPAGVIPAPGQYLLAHASGSDEPLATPLFAAATFPGGFLAPPPIPSTWSPGTQLHLRGPLGRGFRLPSSARRIALVALKCSSRILLSLLDRAFHQDAAVTLVGEGAPEDLPLQVEVQPTHALLDVCKWADFVAFEGARELLPELREIFPQPNYAMKAEAQVLVRTAMPCGALAACGVCTIEAGGRALLACEDGPEFDFGQVMGWSKRA